MADALTTTDIIDPAVNLVYQKTLLRAARPEYIHAEFAQKYSIKNKMGNTMKFRRYNLYAAALVPITEGITPNGHRQSKVDLQAQCSQFGDFATLTDVVSLITEDANIVIEVDLQNDQMRNTEDQLVRDVLAASASSTTCSNGSGTETLLNKSDINAVRQTLRGANAKYLTSLIKAAQGQGTSPIRPSFFGIAHTDLEDDLEAVAGFKETANYPNQAPVHVAEKGQTGNVRWLTTTQGYVSSGTYSLPIIGQKAYGMIKIDGGNAQAIVKGLGSAGTADPLNQRATVGWKMWQVARILNDAFIHVLKCTNG